MLVSTFQFNGVGWARNVRVILLHPPQNQIQALWYTTCRDTWNLWGATHICTEIKTQADLYTSHVQCNYPHYADCIDRSTFIHHYRCHFHISMHLRWSFNSLRKCWGQEGKSYNNVPTANRTIIFAATFKAAARRNNVCAIQVAILCRPNDSVIFGLLWTDRTAVHHTHGQQQLPPATATTTKTARQQEQGRGRRGKMTH